MGVRAKVLPMSDERVRTTVETAAGTRELQEFLILDHGEGEIGGVTLHGIEAAKPTPEVLEAIAAAELIVIAPSNPVISIGPILALAGVRDAIAASGAPVVAVSPLVGGRSVKGPTEAFLRAARAAGERGRGRLALRGDARRRWSSTTASPTPPDDLPTLACPTMMSDAATRRALAERVLEFARSLARRT